MIKIEPEDYDMLSKGLKSFIEIIGPFLSFIKKICLIPIYFFISLPQEVQYVILGMFVFIGMLILRYFVIHYDEIYIDLIDD